MILNEQLDVRFEYAVSALPCAPCRVTFNFSMTASPSGYVAFGFKELLAAYHGGLGGHQPVPEIPECKGLASPPFLCVWDEIVPRTQRL